MKTPIAAYVLFCLHLLLGINGLYGGGALMIDTSRGLLGASVEWLAHTPFKNFFIPGMILLLFNGVFPLFVLAGLIWRFEWPWTAALNIYPKRFWAWTYSLFVGLILIIWIVVQQFMVPFFWLQPTLSGIGVLIVIFTMMPGVIRWYSLEKE